MFDYFGKKLNNLLEHLT